MESVGCGACGGRQRDLDVWRGACGEAALTGSSKASAWMDGRMYGVRHG